MFLVSTIEGNVNEKQVTYQVIRLLLITSSENPDPMRKVADPEWIELINETCHSMMETNKFIYHFNRNKLSVQGRCPLNRGSYSGMSVIPTT